MLLRDSGELHPYAACVMFRETRDGDAVRAAFPGSVLDANVNQIIPAMRDGMVADLIENDADAYLISAAPDIAKALADLVQTFHARPDIHALCGWHENAQIQAACDALNKARWRQSQ